MTKVYISIIILTLYGDLIKRFVPQITSLGILYSIALIIVIYISLTSLNRNKHTKSLSREAGNITFLVSSLIFVYLIQFCLTSYNIPFLASLIGLVYPCMPLLYCVTIAQSNFNFLRFANLFNFFMIPINTVGLIQSRVDSNFLKISTDIYEGIKIRSGGGYVEAYERIPALFASPGRYAEIGMIQVYFGLILLLCPRHKNNWYVAWLLFNVISGFLGCIIAGKRLQILMSSSILILVFALIVKILAIDFSIFKNQNAIKQIKLLLPKKSSLAILLTALSITILLLISNINQLSSFFSDLASSPVIEHTQRSISQGGEAQERLIKAYQNSLPSNEVSILGEGLGINWVGEASKEFSIRAIWRSSGLLFGTFMLLCLGGVIGNMLILTIKSIIDNQIFKFVLFGFPLIATLQGLLAGLTSLYELSSGILWWLSIGATILYTRNYNK